MRYAATAFIASVLTCIMLVFSEAHGSAASVRVINLVDKARHGTWACQRALGRHTTRSVYSERHTRSLAYRRWVLRLWRGRSGRCHAALVRARARPHDVRGIICQVFGSHCSEALRVVGCETGGTFSIYARNGDYLGLFQEGSYARSRYGFGWDAWTQTRSAHRYWLDAGWGPWSCASIVGIR